MSERVLRIGLLGCGTVGAAVARLLHEHREDIARRAGRRLEITAVAVRDPIADATSLTREAFAADPMAVIDDPDVDIVCELIGGYEPAGSLILAAFDREKPVVTANKELLANRGRELFDASDAKGLDLYFEAAVGGGIPLIRPLKESLTGERLSKVLGIVNGTTNFILTRMTEEGSGYADALAEAQRLGYAEADPTADVEGHDAAAKCAILASIAFNARAVAGDVYREGIANVTPEDIEYARRLGYVVKLLAIAEMGDDERIAARVHPAMIPAAHPLASVRDAYNAVFVQGPNVGELMFYGPGAGGDATATAVVGDPERRAQHLGRRPRRGCTCFLERTIRPMGEMRGQYYILLRVEDRPGALAEIAGVFGRGEVSIKSVWQEGVGDDAQLVFITHRAREGAFQAAVTRAPRPTGRRGGPTSSASRPRSNRWRTRGAASSRSTARDHLPVTDATPIVTLGEGGTPLVRSESLSVETGCEVWLKYEGANPTASFKDRGMTVAISKALEEGARPSCAPRPATRARARRVRRQGRAHMRVLVPKGKSRSARWRHARPRRTGPRGRGQLRRGVRAARELAEATRSRS